MECALVAPLLVLIVLGSMDVGQFVNVSQVVNDASREGARRASRSTLTNESEVKAAVESFFADAFPNVPAKELNAALTVNVRDGDGGKIKGGGDLTTIPFGSPVSVQVIFQYDAVRWMAGFAGVKGKSIQTTTIMRRE